LRICIHRGTKQIGGTCIEVEAQGKRIALDVGLPLDADETTKTESLLPSVSGFTDPDDSLLGVIISHPHMDHYGLAVFLRPDLPVYIGERANAILKVARNFVPDGMCFENPIYYEAWKPFDVGPFHVTPYLADHSAFDAYAFLIEADDQRLFYSGDFRGHGRKKKVFEKLIKNPPKDIDVLMMEGTTISRTGTEQGFPEEDDLEEAFVEDIKRTEGFYLVYTSAQNIDRVVTVYRAAKRTGRRLVIDLYAAIILEATGTDSIPQSSWDDVNLYIPFRQRIYVKDNELFDDLKRHSVNRIHPEELAENPNKYVMLIRPWMRRDKALAENTTGARCAYSMWSGYLEEDSLKTFRKWLDERNIPMTQIHTSGHAPVKDLKKFATALAPKRLVPIHSFEADRFAEHFENVETKNDGEWWEV